MMTGGTDMGLGSSKGHSMGAARMVLARFGPVAALAIYVRSRRQSRLNMV